MVYVFGLIGFVCGFVLGQIIIAYLLRGVKTEDLLNDKLLRFKYGTFNWGIAFVSGYGAVLIYQQWF